MSAINTNSTGGPYRMPLFLLVLAVALIFGRPDMSIANGMQGPPGSEQLSRPPAAAEKVYSRSLLGAIRFFQTYISPTDGARCRFAPTCSAFGHQAIRDHGPWLGMLMTTDRLMRCNYWTDAAAYPHLPSGRITDPVASNLGGE